MVTEALPTQGANTNAAGMEAEIKSLKSMLERLLDGQSNLRNVREGDKVTDLVLI
jgi:hypothetical protein